MIIVKRMKKKKIEKTLKYSKLDCKRCRMENWKEKTRSRNANSVSANVRNHQQQKKLVLNKKKFFQHCNKSGN